MTPAPTPPSPVIMAERLRRCEARLAQLEDQVGMIRGGHKPPRKRQPIKIPELTMGQYLMCVVFILAMGIAVQIWKGRGDA